MNLLTISLSPTLEALITSFLQQFSATLARIEKKMDAAYSQERLQMSVLDDRIKALTAQVQADTDATSAATKLINGITAQIAAAVSAAQAAGATTAQLAELTALQASLKANDDTLAAAVVANTPPPPPPAPPV